MMTTFSTPVALIAPYPEMAELARAIVQEFERPIAIEVGDLQEGLRKGRLLVEQGTGQGSTLRPTIL